MGATYGPGQAEQLFMRLLFWQACRTFLDQPFDRTQERVTIGMSDSRMNFVLNELHVCFSILVTGAMPDEAGIRTRAESGVFLRHRLRGLFHESVAAGHRTFFHRGIICGEFFSEL